MRIRVYEKGKKVIGLFLPLSFLGLVIKLSVKYGKNKDGNTDCKNENLKTGAVKADSCTDLSLQDYNDDCDCECEDKDYKYEDNDIKLSEADKKALKECIAMLKKFKKQYGKFELVHVETHDKDKVIIEI
jgi:hypothetical protein